MKTQKLLACFLARVLEIGLNVRTFPSLSWGLRRGAYFRRWWRVVQMIFDPFFPFRVRPNRLDRWVGFLS